jgi:hypothetical protein
MDSLAPVALAPRHAAPPARAAGVAFPRSVRVAILMIAVLALGVQRANATLQVLEPTESIAARADVIAIGGVRTVEAEWDGGRIVSRVVVDVHGVVKGESRDAMVLYAPGGSVGGIGMHVSGSPSFHAGDESVLFLRAFSDRARGVHFRVVGGTQGKVDVERGEDGTKMVRWLRPDLGRVDAVPLGEFTARVAAMATERRR